MAKRRVFSHYDILVGDLNIGMATVVYYSYEHYIGNITVEIHLNKTTHSLVNVQLASNWVAYIDEGITTQSDEQAINLIRRLVGTIILNSGDYIIHIEPRRHVFNFDINIQGKVHRFLLVYEFNVDQAKRVIIPPNDYKKYAITEDDHNIVEEMRQYFLSLIKTT